MSPDLALCLPETRAWVERAVIGLNLCPFARGVQVKGQLRTVLSEATTPEDLLQDLHRELQTLVAADPQALETTLLVHPRVLTDFLDFNDFLGVVDALLEELGLDGEIQVASFHPDYQFAGTEADDISNATNRAPYPTLHLLREASIERAVASFPEPESIFEANMQTLEALGPQGWNALRAACLQDARRSAGVSNATPGSDAGDQSRDRICR
jgi:uncharacterized protein